MPSRPFNRDLTLTLSNTLGPEGWGNLATLTALTALNINAWGDVAPVESTSAMQKVQNCEHLSLLRGLPLK